jgi:HlyD family secretion protein
MQRMTDDEPGPLPAALPVAGTDEFFPAVSRWARMGGVLLVVGFAALVLLSSVLRYNVTVRAQAYVRPAGELRVVQAQVEGAVTEILVAESQRVEKGSVLARVDDSRLRREHSKLRTALDNTALQVEQIRAQLKALDRQIAAEENLLARRQTTAEAELKLRQRELVQLTATTAADVEAARAEVEFASEELSRYRTLAEDGAVSARDVRAKETELSALEARLARVEAALDPSDAGIEIAAENIVQEQARGEAMLATLLREREQLRQRMIETETSRGNYAEDLEQVDSYISSATIRAPVTGVIQELTLRNPGQLVQEGDLVARIAPADDALEIKAVAAIQDIGAIAVGQRVHMRVSACPYPDYGTLGGTVTAISPDVVRPLDARVAYGAGASGGIGYEVTARPDTLVLQDRARRCKIQPGMEGRADIVSDEQTVLQFLLGKARLIT